MPREERKYKVAEIALAAKLSPSAVYQRMRARGIPANRDGLTLDQVKAIVRRLPVKRMNRAHAAELRKQLQNDGYL